MAKMLQKWSERFRVKGFVVQFLAFAFSWVVYISRQQSWRRKLIVCVVVTIWLPTTALAEKVKQSATSVCPSICFHSIFWTDWTLDLSFLCAWAIARLRLKVKVTRQGQRSMAMAYGHVNAVTRSHWPRSSIKGSFYSVFRIYRRCSRCSWRRPSKDTTDPLLYNKRRTKVVAYGSMSHRSRVPGNQAPSRWTWIHPSAWGPTKPSVRLCRPCRRRRRAIRLTRWAAKERTAWSSRRTPSTSRPSSTARSRSTTAPPPRRTTRSWASRRRPRTRPSATGRSVVAGPALNVTSSSSPSSCWWPPSPSPQSSSLSVSSKQVSMVLYGIVGFNVQLSTL